MSLWTWEGGCYTPSSNPPLSCGHSSCSSLCHCEMTRHVCIPHAAALSLQALPSSPAYKEPHTHLGFHGFDFHQTIFSTELGSFLGAQHLELGFPCWGCYVRNIASSPSGERACESSHAYEHTCIWIYMSITVLYHMCVKVCVCAYMYMLGVNVSVYVCVRLQCECVWVCMCV